MGRATRAWPGQAPNELEKIPFPAQDTFLERKLTALWTGNRILVSFGMRQWSLKQWSSRVWSVEDLD